MCNSPLVVDCYISTCSQHCPFLLVACAHTWVARTICLIAARHLAPVNPVSSSSVLCCHPSRRRIHQLESRAESLEAKLDATASEAGHLMRRADRHETATSTLQSQLESATRAAKEYEQAAVDADSRLREVSRQVLDLQMKCEELSRKCEAAGRDRQQAEEQCKQQLAAAEVRTAEMPDVMWR